VLMDLEDGSGTAKVLVKVRSGPERGSHRRRVLMEKAATAPGGGGEGGSAAAAAVPLASMLFSACLPACLPVCLPACLSARFCLSVRPFINHHPASYTA
jgi:hypothetical protein